MNVITYPTRHDVVINYDFSNGKTNIEGEKWFMTPLEAQLRNFKDGLGKITYFITKRRDLQQTPYMDIEPPETRLPFLYEMITDFVYIENPQHPHDCNCGKCLTPDEINFMKLDDYDDCYLGVGETYGEHPALVYDQGKIIEKLMKNGMDREEAEEYFSFNILGSFLGEKMPIFLNTEIPLDTLNTK